MNKIRLGILGLGTIWEKAHKPALEKLTDIFEITAFCDRSEKIKTGVIKEFPNRPFYSDYKSFIKENIFDAVVVLTPLKMNASIAIEVLSAGKNVFIEKPMAVNTTIGKELIKYEKSSKKRVFVLEQFVYMEATDKLKNIIDTGELGDILMYERLYHAYIGSEKDGDAGFGQVKWRKNPDFPLGTIFDSGIHDIAFLSKIFGLPTAVYATGRNIRNEYGNYDNIVALFEYRNNLLGTFSHSFFLNGNRNYFYVRGSKGLAFMDDTKIVEEKRNGEKKILRIDHSNLHYKMWKQLAKYFHQNREPYYTTRVALNDLNTIEMIEKSLSTGKKIEIKNIYL
jgi:scyllo-inositol 2-dehydrogenase (NADP+)